MAKCRVCRDVKDMNYYSQKQRKKHRKKEKVICLDCEDKKAANKHKHLQRLKSKKKLSNKLNEICGPVMYIDNLDCRNFKYLCPSDIYRDRDPYHSIFRDSCRSIFSATHSILNDDKSTLYSIQSDLSSIHCITICPNKDQISDKHSIQHTVIPIRNDCYNYYDYYYRYSYRNDTKSHPGYRIKFNIIYHNNYIYLFGGGKCKKNSKQFICKRDMWRLDLSRELWKQMDLKLIDIKCNDEYNKYLFSPQQKKTHSRYVYPRNGHVFQKYKNLAIIWDGISCKERNNIALIINLDTFICYRLKKNEIIKDIVDRNNINIKMQWIDWKLINSINQSILAFYYDGKKFTIKHRVTELNDDDDESYFWKDDCIDEDISDDEFESSLFIGDMYNQHSNFGFAINKRNCIKYDKKNILFNIRKKGVMKGRIGEINILRWSGNDDKNFQSREKVMKIQTKDRKISASSSVDKDCQYIGYFLKNQFVLLRIGESQKEIYSFDTFIGKNWDIERLLWIAYLKNDENPLCYLKKLPKDIINRLLTLLKSSIFN